MTNRIRRIFLIRHTESEGNVDRSVHHRMPDHAIPLSPKGVEQAAETGKALVSWLDETVSSFVNVASWERFRLWNSPYKRTRQTANCIEAEIEFETKPWLEGRRESVLLCEQQFGLFDGVADEDLPKLFPLEHAHYKKCEDFEGRFWSRMPLGESRFDVSQRVHQAFGSFQRDLDTHDIQNIAVVSHGVTIRAFLMMWMHYTPEWFEAEPNPANGSIRLIEFSGNKYVDKGYIFEGFK